MYNILVFLADGLFMAVAYFQILASFIKIISGDRYIKRRRNVPKMYSKFIEYRKSLIHKTFHEFTSGDIRLVQIHGRFRYMNYKAV